MRNAGKPPTRFLEFLKLPPRAHFIAVYGMLYMHFFLAIKPGNEPHYRPERRIRE